MSFCQLVDPLYEAAWFHEVIADILENALKRTLEKKKTRIILTIPPRHGKTQTTSIYFPAWALGKYPTLKFILSSYGADLSTKVGMKTRDVINSQQYQAIFPNVQLRPDSKSKSYWLTKQNGSYFAVGVGGPVTGEGANCFTGDTLIATEEGYKTIKHLISLQKEMKVLSFNHEKNCLEWKRVLASSKRKVSEILRITTDKKRVIRCTPDHRIFVKNKGYIRAQDLRNGDVLIGIQSDEKDFCPTGMQLLQKSISKKKIRSRKMVSFITKGLLLFKNMFSIASRGKKSKKVHNMRGGSRTKDEKVLFKKRMSKIVESSSRKEMFDMQKRFSSSVASFKNLFKNMCCRPSLITNEGDTQSKLQTWDGTGHISSEVLSSSEKSGGKRHEPMRHMSVAGTGYLSPHRSQSKEQCDGEPDSIVQELSFSTSYESDDTVSSIERTSDRENVYDIQVENNNNFFANDILVHNCVILDDPHKNREEAESQTYRDTVWEYYRSTLYSRLEGAGTVIVIMQRWHQDDLVGRLLEADQEARKAGQPTEDWEVINFPAIADSDEFFKGQKTRLQGQALWPSKFPIDVLHNIREVQGTANWSSQYMQDPILAENQEFKKEMFDYFDEEELEGKYLKYFTFCDPAISQKKEADNTVVLTIAKEIHGPNFYRIREDAGKFSPQETVDLIFKHYEMYHSEVYLETVAYQKALKFSLEEQQKIRQRYFRIYETKSGNKETRIRGLLPLYERGVILHRRSDVEYERELLAFPRGKHDDRPDCMSFMLDALNNSSFGKAKQFYPHLLGFGKKGKL